MHKASCKTVAKAKNPERLIAVHWQIGEGTQPATIKIYADARVGLIRDLSETISKQGINILNMNSFETPEKEGITIATVEVKNTEELEDLIRKIRTVKGVYGIDRV